MRAEPIGYAWRRYGGGRVTWHAVVAVEHPSLDDSGMQLACGLGGQVMKKALPASARLCGNCRRALGDPSREPIS